MNEWINFISFLSYFQLQKKIEYRIQNSTKITLYDIIYRNEAEYKVFGFPYLILFNFSGTVCVFSKNLTIKENTEYEEQQK